MKHCWTNLTRLVTFRPTTRNSSNTAIFDFEIICVKDEKFKDTETTTWAGKHIQISVSIPSNLIQEPMFVCNLKLRDLVSSFIDAVENLAEQSKAQWKVNFLQLETVIKSKCACILGTLNRRRSHRVGIKAEDDTSENRSTQFLQMQKIYLIDLKEHFERFCYTLPVFGFNSAKYDIKPIKIYLLPGLLNERKLEPIVIKKN